MANTSFRFVAEWFGKAAKNAKVQRRDDAAKLWEDGLEYLIELHNKNVELRRVAEAMREWIDAVPSDTTLPTMPGFDRDWADSVIDG